MTSQLQNNIVWSLPTKLHTSCLSTAEERCQQSFKLSPISEDDSSLVFPFTEEEYKKGIATLKNKKAAGIDDVLVEQLNNLGHSLLNVCFTENCIPVPTTPACTWWNRPEEDNSSGKLESTHPSRTSVKSDQVFFGVESVMRVNADSLLIRAAATSTSGTLNDLTTDLIMANNNNNRTASPKYGGNQRATDLYPSYVTCINCTNISS